MSKINHLLNKFLKVRFILKIIQTFLRIEIKVKMQHNNLIHWTKYKANLLLFLGGKILDQFLNSQMRKVHQNLEINLGKYNRLQ